MVFLLDLVLLYTRIATKKKKRVIPLENKLHFSLCLSCNSTPIEFGREVERPKEGMVAELIMQKKSLRAWLLSMHAYEHDSDLCT